MITVEVMTMRNGLALANSLRARKEEGKEMRDNNKGKDLRQIRKRCKE